MSDKKQWSWESQKSWVANKKTQSKQLKTHEQQMTPWEIQKAWVALLKKWVAYLKKWTGNKNMRNSKIMSSLHEKKQLMSNKWQHEKLKRHE